jgi:hypothetical protein
MILPLVAYLVKSSLRVCQKMPIAMTENAFVMPLSVRSAPVEKLFQDGRHSCRA